jgi:3-hydroxyacyl-CoA dehydrogenase
MRFCALISGAGVSPQAANRLMSNLVRITHAQGLAVITIDNPPVNALSTEVRQAIREAIEQADNDNRIAAIVLIGAGRTFVAGADIHEFQKITSGSSQRVPEMARLVERIEDCHKPVVAAIHGHALGGGMELAMAEGWLRGRDREKFVAHVLVLAGNLAVIATNTPV